ncbi:ATP phosphoribosyltransferase [Candidatus Terasakiella magnetica]|uniref:ATP phosphoribosyltransferase n=1 Tax=Candidatus Terasakiella magnetica TaxID=1867952 RepID=A0A1C3RHU7_9PROT|nr:ATP phosphoribosyltransferase [Candidatus Terasakiella magnetica]SCA56784.1 ATP phosphoribosyltransferase [Candidatus Terasakiella magnetica]
MAFLKLGIPKGSLEDATIELFEQAGWSIKKRARNYFPVIDDDDIECSLVRSQEMSRYIEDDVLDVGLCGLDWVQENNSDVEVVSDLIYSKVSDKPARWVLVVDKDSPIQSVKDLDGKRVATELVGFTKRYLAENGVKADVEFSWGATEAKVIQGLADAVVEITETGTTIKANGLRIVEELMQTHTVLIANKAALKDPQKKAKIEQVALMLQAALSARHKVLLKMNAPDNNLDEIIKMLPSLHAPTVNALSDQNWHAVETVVNKKETRDLIPQLKAAGAEGILELPLLKVC